MISYESRAWYRSVSWGIITVAPTKDVMTEAEKRIEKEPSQPAPAALLKSLRDYEEKTINLVLTSQQINKGVTPL